MKFFILCFLLCTQAFALPTLEGQPPLVYPVLLVHGATMGGARLKVGPFDFGEYFPGIIPFLSKNGTEVRQAVLPTDASIGERAAILNQTLISEFPGRKVNIIGHSLGGLDARYLASIMNSTQVASITTIGTPHFGSPSADWAVKQMNNSGLWYWLFRLVGFDLKGRRFLPELTTEFMQKKFNEKVKDRADVRYFSVKAFGSFDHKTMSYMLWPNTVWMNGENHPLMASGNDGLVPLESQTWGEVIGTFELDHLAQMNHHEFRKDMTNETFLMYEAIYKKLYSQGL